MNKLGLVAGIACLIWSAFYDWQITFILLLYFVATKSEMIILIDKKKELLVNMISKKL